jgi:hypothetical protein
MTDAAQQISDLETRRRQRCEQSQQKEEPRPSGEVIAGPYAFLGLTTWI